VKKGYMIQLAVNSTISKKTYNLRNTFICSYARESQVKDAMQTSDYKSSLILSKSCPANIIYYVDDIGRVQKWQMVDEDISDE
jgi:hypothetical protein